MLTARQSRLNRLIVAASAQSTEWLIANVHDLRYNLRRRDLHASKLSLIACLRIIAARTDTSGLPYRPRMRAVKSRIFA